MSAVAQLRAVLGLDTGAYKAGMSTAEKATANFQSRLASVGRMMGVAFSAGAVIELGRRVTTLVDGLVKAAAKIETLKLSFVNLGQSEANAAKHMEDLREFATITPFKLENISEASRQLLVLSDGVLGGRDSLRLFGDMAAAVGTDDLADLSFWVGRLYADLASGKSGIERNITALQRLKAISPETAKTLREMAKAGAAGQEIWKSYVDTLKKYEGAMQRASETTEGLTSTMTDNFTDMKAAYGEAFEGPTKTAIKSLTELARFMKSDLGFNTVTAGLGKVGMALSWLRTLSGKKVIPGESMPGGVEMPGGVGTNPPPTEGTPEQKAITSAQKTNDALKRSLLDGLAKITAEYEAKKSETIEELMGTPRDNQELRKILYDRVQILTDAYNRDVEAFKKAEQEKVDAAEKSKQKLIDAHDKRNAEIDAQPMNISGGYRRTDSLAQVGGLVGGDRANIGIASKQLAVLQEMLRRQNEKAVNDRELIEAMQDVEEAVREI